MFSIGEFARHGRISVRMLRHYDAVGLLRPARVDALTSYRYYEAEQLSRLNRIVALKDLGFTLQQVQSIIEDKVGIEEMHGMLRLRQLDLQSQIADSAARLTRIQARLRIIETEGSMPSQDVQVTRIPAVRVAELSGVATSFAHEAIGPVVGPLFEELSRGLAGAGVTPVGPAIVYYQEPTSGEVIVHACLPVSDSVSAAGDVQIVDLPEIAQAATIVHHGSMDSVLWTVQTLVRWIEANGYRSDGLSRELYLQAGDDPSGWVTELQEPINAAAEVES